MPHDYPYTPVSFTQVQINDAFWQPRIEVNRTVTIPSDFQKCEETGRVANFDRAAGVMDGPFEGDHEFNDSDVFKVIEGASYSLQSHPDPKLDAYIDGLIARIAAAQEPDGYLYTARTIDPDHVPPNAGPERWSNLTMSHELYNAGHLYEGAVAHYQATGKRSFLDIALKNANLLCATFGPDRLRRVPGHQEVELGLVKLYRVTGEAKYLDLARFFLDERGHANGRELMSAFGIPDYMQDHLPVTEQSEAVGHAVRATYMYSGMADVAALTGDRDYINAIQRIWENVVHKKLALHGGIGARHHSESFGADYELPNATSYNETCASIANIFWNHRLFLLTGQSRYIDVLERSLYNGFLAGVSMAGDTFFYVNPLEWDGVFPFNRDNSCVRQPWFSCSCCPTNVVRLLPSLPGYIYAIQGDRLYVNLYIGNRAQVSVAGASVGINQQTRYPWSGDVRLTVAPDRPARFSLALRIPGWAMGRPVPSDLYAYLNEATAQLSVKVNGQGVAGQERDGYFWITRTWQPGDVVDLSMEMPIRRVIAHEMVNDNRGRVALERGPIVYAAEAVDHGGTVLDLLLPDSTTLVTREHPELLGGVTTIEGKTLDRGGNERAFVAIPYYAWSHRQPGEMEVWFPRRQG